MAKRLEVIRLSNDVRVIVHHLASSIAREYDGLTPVLLCVLKGAFVFVADLARELRSPVEVEFVRAASYGKAQRPLARPAIYGMPDCSVLTGRHVIIVDDIIDSGQTLEAVKAYVTRHNPASVAACVLLAKRLRRPEWPVVPDYIGTEIPSEFVVGYGMGDGEADRGLSGIYVVHN